MKRLLFLSSLLLFSNVLLAQGWGETQKIVPDDRFTFQQFGAVVAIDGNYAVVGVAVSNTSAEAYVYENDGNGNWIQVQKLESDDPNQFDHFGTTVTISGDYILIGAWGDNEDANNENYIDSAGAAYVFEKQASGLFEFTQKIVASNREINNHFGIALALNGDYAIVGTLRDAYDVDGNNYLANAGAAFIFERDGSGTWNEVKKIVASDRAAEDLFAGDSVSIDGNYAVVGARYEDEDENGVNTVSDTGSAYVFERDGSGTWNEVQKIVASSREFSEWFGYAVDISGNTIIVGASNEYLEGNTGAQYGAAYVFEPDGNGVWNEVQKIRPSYLEQLSKFGQYLSIDGNNIIVGAFRVDVGGASDGGAAFIFEKDGTGIWNQTASMYDDNVNTSDNFGSGVAISGNYAIVGAFQEDEDETDMNTLGEAGSAYIFDMNEPNTLDPLETLSIVENDLGSEFKTYPNPNQGNFTINLGKIYNQVTISITNSLGQEIQTKNLQSSDKVTLDLNAKGGIYFVNISTEEGKSATIKILKN